MNAVGSHVQKLRKQQDLSQDALAEKLNVTRQAVSQWERSNTQPDFNMLKRIAEVFGADIHQVIYRKNGKQRRALRLISGSGIGPGLSSLVRLRW